MLCYLESRTFVGIGDNRLIPEENTPGKSRSNCVDADFTKDMEEQLALVETEREASTVMDQSTAEEFRKGRGVNRMTSSDKHIGNDDEPDLDVGVTALVDEWSQEGRLFY